MKSTKFISKSNGSPFYLHPLQLKRVGRLLRASHQRNPRKHRILVMMIQYGLTRLRIVRCAWVMVMELLM
jgi:hypothetical protein